MLSVGGFILGSKQVTLGAIVVVDEEMTNSQHIQHVAAKAAAEAAPLSNNQTYLGLSESELVAMVATIKPRVFETAVLPVFFKSDNYHSFNCIINAWSFRRKSSGPDCGSYFHEVSIILRGH